MCCCKGRQKSEQPINLSVHYLVIPIMSNAVFGRDSIVIQHFGYCSSLPDSRQRELLVVETKNRAERK